MGVEKLYMLDLRRFFIKKHYITTRYGGWEQMVVF